MAAGDSGLTAGSVEVEVRAALAPFREDLKRALGVAKEFDGQVSHGFQGVERATSSLNKAAGATSNIMSQLRTAVAGVVGALGVRELVSYADTWSDMTSRIRVFVGDTETARDVLGRLETVARRTYSSLTTTADAFIFNAQSLRALGATTQQQLDFTDALNNALVVSGAKGQRAASIQYALSRALGQGALRAQDLNQVMAVGGRVAEVLAEELGTTTLGLRKLGPEAKITSDVIVNALIKRMELLQKQAESMPATVGDAFVLMKNAVLGFVGTIDQSTGVTEGMAKVMIGWADTLRASAEPAAEYLTMAVSALRRALEAVGGAGTVASTAIGILTARYAAHLAIPFVTSITNSVTAIIALERALGAASVASALFSVSLKAVQGVIIALGATIRAHPIMAIATALGAAAGVAYAYRDEIQKTISPLAHAQSLHDELRASITKTREETKKAEEATKSSTYAINADTEALRQRTLAEVAALRARAGQLSNTGVGATAAARNNEAAALRAEADALMKTLGEVVFSNFPKAAATFSAPKQVSEEIKKAFQSLEERLDPLSAATRDYAESMETLKEAEASGLITGKQRLALIEQLNAATATARAEMTGADRIADYNQREAEAAQDTIDEITAKWNDYDQRQADIKQARADSRTAIMEETAVLRDQTAALGMTAGASARYMLERKLLTEAQREGAVISTEEKRAISDVAKAYGEATQASEDAQKALQKSIQDADAFRYSMGSFLSDFTRGIRSGESALQSLGRALDRMVDKLIDMAINDLVAKAFGPMGTAGKSGGSSFFDFLGSAIGGMFGGGSSFGSAVGAVAGSNVGNFDFAFAHGGGRPGIDALPKKSLPRSLAFNAPRFHLGVDEVPAVLLKGERVLNRQQSKEYDASSNRGPVTINIDARGSSLSRAEIRAEFARSMAEAAPYLIRASVDTMAERQRSTGRG